MASLGAAGFIGCCGYIAEAGRESFLGIQIRDFAFDRYASAFARFVLDSLELIGSLIRERPVLAIFSALALIGTLLLLLTVRRTRVIVILVLAVTAAFVLVRAPIVFLTLEVPTMQVDGFLTRNANLDRGFDADVARNLWRMVTCRHDKTAHFEKTCAALRQRSKNPAREWYRSVMLQVLLLVIATGLFQVALTHAARRVRLQRPYMLGARLLQPVAISLTVLTMLMLPYVHAKALSEADYPRVAIILRETEMKIVGFLIHQSADQLTIYETEDAKRPPSITIVPTTLVARIVSERAATSANVLDIHVQLTGSP